jgi:hypothetical protein
MGANDRESLAAHPSRAHGRSARDEDDEEEHQGPRRGPPAERVTPLGLRSRLRRTPDRGDIGAIRDPTAMLPESDRLRQVEAGRRPLRGQLADLSPTRRLVACRRRRRPRRLHPAPGRAVRPRARRRHLCRQADPDPCRRRRGSRVEERVGRLTLLIGRDGRIRLRPRRRARCGIGLRSRWRRRRDRRRGGRRVRSGGFRCGRRLGRGGRVGSATRRKELERIDVRLRVTDPNAEVHVGHRVLRLPGRTGLGQHVALRDRLAATDVQLAEMRQRCLVLACCDRDGEAVGGDRPGEGHRAGRRRAERRAAPEPDIDASMLAGCVRIAADGEPAQYRAVRGPGPRPRRRANGERADHRHGQCCEHTRCLESEHGSTVATADAGGKTRLTSCYRERR